MDDHGYNPGKPRKGGKRKPPAPTPLLDRIAPPVAPVLHDSGHVAVASPSPQSRAMRETGPLSQPPDCDIHVDAQGHCWLHGLVHVSPLDEMDALLGGGK